MKLSFLLFTVLLSFNVYAQELTGQQLLDKAIEHHDPNGEWASFKGSFQITMTTPDQPERVSHVYIDLKSQHFQLVEKRDSIMITYKVDKDKSMVEKTSLKSTKANMVTIEEDNDRAILMKNYYTYLYGLPMKLKDQGSNIPSKVEKKIFKGKEYLVLKVSYLPGTGSDVWYFYFDPSSYKMEVYQFFKTDKNGMVVTDSGEYILLSENHIINDINMPKTRKWYFNKDDKFLGADVITK